MELKERRKDEKAKSSTERLDLDEDRLAGRPLALSPPLISDSLSSPSHHTEEKGILIASHSRQV